MTKELLEQYPDICKEIEDLERAAGTPVSDVVSGSSDEYPFTKHSVAIRGMPPEHHRARIEELKRKRDEIEAFAESIEDYRKRRLVKYVMKYGCDWNVIRRCMGGDKSADAIRKEFERFLKNFS
ncbi:hypothetical protein [Anaeromassilibacillus senegalensis]|uniref:RNA polymerase subunit sigma-70 n=1 Tax=Anaeromassilibacillus senegalensis TaxID=1673717 RepID=A0ABS9CMJ9_9FIRM|nr:hypothetical protein [Anaeromassilibacillus senegalensis]MCF2651833.1 hypothetical protein [Anaeromassilibacillus senegalensis]